MNLTSLSRSRRLLGRLASGVRTPTALRTRSDDSLRGVERSDELVPDVDHVDGQDLEGLTTAQRAAIALDLLPGLTTKEDQDKAPGPGRPALESGKAAARAALAVGIGRTSVETAVAIQKRDPSVIERMRSGELNVAQAARAVGLTGRSDRGTGDTPPNAEKDALGRYQPRTYYGKGDKWKEAAAPLVRYLSAWERRGFEFRHVAPKEARRRLALIAELQGKLDAAKADLERRAHSATLTMTTKKG